jgi:hypothetical protein
MYVAVFSNCTCMFHFRDDLKASKSYLIDNEKSLVMERVGSQVVYTNRCIGYEEAK